MDFPQPDDSGGTRGGQRLVFALASGEWVRQANDREGGLYQVDARVQRLQPAILYALDAATGKELWSSGSQVTSFTHNGQLTIANGRVYSRLTTTRCTASASRWNTSCR